MYIKISEGIYSVGVQDPSLRIFDIIMKTEFGTTYNSYLLKGQNFTALIDTVHENFIDEFLENIEEVADISNIDYIISNHTEPDHSGSLRRLLEINPNITVISTRAGYNFLRAITNLDFKSRIVKDGEMLNLGGLTLKFIVAPNLHWPDSMFTYIEENSYLFSCDFLGAHCTVPKMFDKYVKDETNYNRAFKYYYDAIFGPFKKFVLNGLEKIKDLKLSAVLPSHGPILIEKIGENIEKYRKWSQIDNEKLAKNATIVYVSAYGCTEKLAKIAEKTLKDDSLNANIYNAIRSDPAEISASIASSKFLLFGSPTINSDALKPIWDVVSTIDAFSAKSKFSAVFGSYGWTGEAVPALCERLRTLKFHVFEDGFKVNFVPSREDIENMQKFVERFIESAK